MTRRAPLIVSLLAACAALSPVSSPPASAQEEDPVEIRPGRVTGRPTPRFESLRNADTNLRVGPSENTKILWVYHRRGMPVEVYDEYDVWRRVRAADGETGWLHHSQLSMARTGLVMESAEIRAAPDAASALVAKVEPTVALSLVECRAEFCRVEAGGLQGWIARGPLWGIRPGELF